MEALIFDCDGKTRETWGIGDGVILESEDLHRLAYNAAFAHFDVKIGGTRVVWTEEFYDDLQNKVGGGKPKMRWYFGHEGWPSSSLGPAPGDKAGQEALVDALQAWKTDEYQRMIASGDVDARPGVLRLMDEARAAGLKLGVCSAATKESVVFVLKSLLGEGRLEALDVFLAGDDVPSKKPDPLIYETAAKRLGITPRACVVVEDSAIGVAAAVGAGMRCVVTYTRSTRAQAFAGAERVVASLGGAGAPAEVTVADLLANRVVQDDRVDFAGV